MKMQMKKIALGEKHIWIENSDYVVIVSPNGENTLMTTDDLDFPNSIHYIYYNLNLL